MKSDENWGGEGCWLYYSSTTWEWYRFRFILGVPSTSPWNLFVSLLWVHWRSTCCWCAWTLRDGSECRHGFPSWSRKSAHSWPVSSPASPHHVHRVWLKHLCRNLFSIYWIHKRTSLARAQSRTLLSFYFFNFRRALIGYSNGFNFNDVIYLVARTKMKWFWEFWVELDLYCSFGIYRVLRILRILRAVGKTLRKFQFLIVFKKSCWHWERESSDW